MIGIFQLSLLTHQRNAGINTKFVCHESGNGIGGDWTLDPWIIAIAVEHFTNWAIWPTQEMLEQIFHMLTLLSLWQFKVSMSAKCVVMELARIEP